MIYYIIDQFEKHYRWSFDEISSDVPLWDTLEEWTHSDGGGLTGIRILYRTAPIGGFPRYVKIVTNFDDVVSIQWGNELEPFADDFLLEVVD